MIIQHEFRLRPYARGYHLITREVLQALPALPETGLLTLFIQHTSAALTINENADPSVRTDFETIFNRLVPENMSGLVHTLEGPDDMPSHIRMALTRSSEVIPVINGRMTLGTWQGIFLFEHRRASHHRKVSVSVVGE